METALMQTMSAWSWLMERLLYINLVLSVIIVFFQRRDPKAVWTWILALYFVPVFGFAFYLVICQDMHKSKMFRVKEGEDRLKFSARSQEEFIRNHDMALSDPLARDYEDLVLFNMETSGAVLTADNRVEIFTDGQAKFADLRKEMGQAKRFIHMQYYIIKDDQLFDSIRPILEAKAREGVEVRVLYDGMGGRFMPKKKWKALRQSGVKVGEFFPAFLGRIQVRLNYRNHRKIVVIDGRIGYVGGFNIGKEYISQDPKIGYWRDTHLKLKGGAVISLQIRFALDWKYATGENLFQDIKYFGTEEELAKESTPVKGGASSLFQITHTEPGRPPVGIQIVASGPDNRCRQIRDNYLQLFHKARKHIYIQTPYFVPDDAVLSALQIAARSGVDVRLMVPCKPDHPFVYWATYSYVGDLLSAGARCYVYENGFLHAKGVMVDGRVCSYGTANMDIRSFELNFEVNAVIYDEATTDLLEQAFIRDLMRCREITMGIYGERSLWIRFKEQSCRLLSPLL